MLAQPRFWRWLLVGWVCIYALSVLTIGGSNSARAWFLVQAGLWCVLLVALFRWRRIPQTLHLWLRRVDIVVTNLAVLLVLGEVSLRTFSAVSGDPLVLNEALDSWRLEPNRTYGGRLTTNSQGYPSREFQVEKRPGVRRIAALGDSFAVGVVPQDQNFLTLLERKLPNTEVYNFGVPGIGPREYDSILRSDVWRYQPDLVLVCFFVGNDVTGWWPLAKANKLDPKAHRLYVLGHRAWRLGRECFRRSEEAGLGYHEALEYAHLSRQTHLGHEVGRMVVCRYSQLERVEKCWIRTFKYLESINAQCRHHGVPLAVVLIPDEFQVNPALLAEARQFSLIPSDDVDLTIPQRRLTAYYQERDVACLDLMPAFAATTDAYYPRDTHWNEKGNRLAADQVADWLQQMERSSSGTAGASAATTGRSASNSPRTE
jgi:lysophospholipase L1-like esterase